MVKEKASEKTKNHLGFALNKLLGSCL